MNERIEHILLMDSWSSSDLEDVENACRSNPDVARFIGNWARLSAAAGARFRDQLPDPKSLVFLALSRSEFSDTLTPAELSLAKEAERKIELSASSESMEMILGRVQTDAEIFDEAWKATQATTGTSSVRSPQPDRSPLKRVVFARPLIKWGYGIAAGIAAAVVIVVVAVGLLRPDSPGVESFTYRADDGQTHIINLPDGSNVRLIDGSSLRHVAGTDGFDRRVFLDGKAFFDVSHGATQFSVTTENAIVNVHGTSFGVVANSAESITEVVLVSGSVEFEALEGADSSVFLVPGQYSRVIRDARPSAPADVNLDLALTWTDLFIFRDTALSVVAERLSESFDVEISVDSAIATRTLTGTFARELGLDSILEAVAAALNVVIEQDDVSRISISG